MYVDIYFKSPFSLQIGEVEEIIEEVLGKKMEVTGSGSGIDGGNIDIEIFDDEYENILMELKELLKRLRFPSDTILVIEGKRDNLYD